MKQNILFLNFLLFLVLISSISLTVRANDYGLGVYEDQELRWKCNACNDIEMEKIFGNDWNDDGIFNNLSLVKRMKWKINNIRIN
jgi:hypothetical protein